MLISALLPLLGAVTQSDSPPWITNRPIAMVHRDLYLRSPAPRTAVYLWAGYVGPGLVREEIRTEEHSDDQFLRPERRRSADNGRTWSAFERVTNMWPHAKDDYIFWAPGFQTTTYDPETRVTVAMWLRQHLVNGRYYNHTFARLSHTDGLTWREPKLLRYETGDDFDPADPLKRSFLERNNAYFGQQIIRHSNGTLIFPVCSTHIPDDAPDPNPRQVAVWDTPPDSRNIGSLCFIGRWNAAGHDYDWTAGKPVWVPRHVSSRGLMEPDVSELTDGRLLVIWRGANHNLDPKEAPGRKWFSVSSDGGMTLGPVAELRYDDGSRFYSPSSYHLLVRHSVNHKLYWFGNISAGPTSANDPRYPLIVAEVDERIPALKKQTVTVIDDRQPGEGVVSLSNFAVFENRETHNFELYMTRCGDKEGDSVYKYVLAL